MITQQEKEDIISGFERIRGLISKILRVSEEFELKKNEICELIERSYPAENVAQLIEPILNWKPTLLLLQKNFLSMSVIKPSMNDQYRIFLLSEIANFDEVRILGLQIHSERLISHFLDELTDGQTTSSENCSKFVENVHRLIPAYNKGIEKLQQLQSGLFILYQVADVEGTIVMVGANGSGKSTFARQLNGMLASNIVILSAQHFLYYYQQNTISAIGDEIQKVHKFQYNPKTEGDLRQLITSDMNDLITALLSQHIDYAVQMYDEGNQEISCLTRTVQLWEEIIVHRHIEKKRTGLYAVGEKMRQYDFNLLSDGEKAVFYYIAHILLAPEDSHIIVDEPENHLHMTICNQLWDRLEKERDDCKFIYLTHNLNFATTRSNSTILWNKKFEPPYSWDFEILPENEILPEVLVMELVGSRKNICFCEGDRSSIDYRLYSILFPKYTVIPVAGHRNVIDYVEAYNSIPSFVTQAVGIIDGDHHLSEQIQKWREKKIYVLPINEVENLLCDDYILQNAIDCFCSGEDALDIFHKEFWEQLQHNRERQAIAYVNEYVNNKFKDNFLHEKQNIDKLVTELQNITSKEEIQGLYSDTICKIEEFIESKNYNAALRFVNLKGRLTRDIAKKVIVDKYENRVLDLIKKDEKIQQYILTTYFSDFNF